MSHLVQAHALAVILCGAGARLALSRRPPRRRARAVLGPAGAGPPLARIGRPATPPSSPGAGDPQAAPPGETPSGPAPIAVLRRRPSRVAAACLLGGLLVSWWGGSPLPLVAALGLAPLTARRLRHRERRRRADLRGDAVITFCSALAAEARAGRRPEDALREAGLDFLGPAAAQVARAARTGGDVAAALRAAACLPGAGGLAGVAACWRVATDGGASLATGLDRVAHALRTERDTREDLRAQLAGPRTTAVVLACLPAAGLLLGTALGADPLAVLLNQPAGLACLLIGVALEAAGLLWTAGIIRAAERSSA
ncbi:type II secretion system F family protein [Streptomyces bohaiensis]|uniref:type II secretion system F family protein n=1 Tax=Streptomyces bohaiensis TaxID=1431344 RepID=UPI003B8062FC